MTAEQQAAWEAYSDVCRRSWSLCLDGADYLSPEGEAAREEWGAMQETGAVAKQAGVVVNAHGGALAPDWVLRRLTEVAADDGLPALAPAAERSAA